MKTIVEAKKHFGERYRAEEGFVGVGICLHANAQALQVYVEDADFPLAKRLKRETTFEGFPVVVEVTGKVRALPA